MRRNLRLRAPTDKIHSKEIRLEEQKLVKSLSVTVSLHAVCNLCELRRWGYAIECTDKTRQSFGLRGKPGVDFRSAEKEGVQVKGGHEPSRITIYIKLQDGKIPQIYGKKLAQVLGPKQLQCTFTFSVAFSISATTNNNSDKKLKQYSFSQCFDDFDDDGSVKSPTGGSFHQGGDRITVKATAHTFSLFSSSFPFNVLKRSWMRNTLPVSLFPTFPNTNGVKTAFYCISFGINC